MHKQYKKRITRSFGFEKLSKSFEIFFLADAYLNDYVFFRLMHFFIIYKINQNHRKKMKDLINFFITRSVFIQWFLIAMIFFKC